ncbi:MAG: UDP-N-acetylglucosamine diphosphorylase/glucosamine-1-phosphate N-acetyltransferase [Bacteroidetes bacterium OLB11]|nr:MAG: UDP-N-acetylglucosamine diphosphorylase/glucosamine-1-phosphate N-acetyltransferase [Bacteroidetes bacterium OLB11]
MNFVLFDDKRYSHFLPLTHSRPISELRCGILTMREKWEFVVGLKPYYFTQKHLQEKFPFELSENNIFINSALFPDKQLFEAIIQLKKKFLFDCK